MRLPQRAGLQSFQKNGDPFLGARVFHGEDPAVLQRGRHAVVPEVLAPMMEVQRDDVRLLPLAVFSIVTQPAMDRPHGARTVAEVLHESRVVAQVLSFRGQLDNSVEIPVVGLNVLDPAPDIAVAGVLALDRGPQPQEHRVPMVALEPPAVAVQGAAAALADVLVGVVEPGGRHYTRRLAGLLVGSPERPVRAQSVFVLLLGVQVGQEIGPHRGDVRQVPAVEAELILASDDDAVPVRVVGRLRPIGPAQIHHDDVALRADVLPVPHGVRGRRNERESDKGGNQYSSGCHMSLFH